MALNNKADNKEKFYITTAIAYTNASPHIGFALELIQTDVIARWNLLKGKDVFYLTGTDENGVKNNKCAKEAGVPTLEFVTKNAEAVKELLKKYNILNTSFIRTTDQKIHWPSAQKVWKLLEKKGDLYKKTYTGLYCFGCESFKTDKELIDGKCSNHDRKPEIVEEENYFFKLSKYNQQILDAIESDRFRILPKTRKNEILSLLKSGLEDVSFSRSVKSLNWGVPVPEDKEQTIYVWCDALINYLSGIGYTSDPEKFKKYWPADIHVIGKDILRFHAAIWPGILLSAGIGLPKEMYVHGFINVEGKKMSKSLGNVIEPFEQQKKYSTDAVRYFLIREIPSTEDGSYSEKILVERLNSDLAEGLGNLVNRILVMTEKYNNGKIPGKEIDESLEKKCKEIKEKAEERIGKFELHHFLAELWKLVDEGNRYVNEKEPWAVKDETERDKVMYNLLELLRHIAVYLWPVIPETSEKIISQLGLKKESISFSTLEKFGYLKAGTKITRGKILFRKI